MKLLFDFLPIIAFFIAYKFFGIYIATGAAIGLSLLQVLGYWLKYRTVSSLQLISLGTIVLFGSATLFFHNALIIKWKPSVLYWLLAALFTGSRFFGKKPFVQHMMESNIALNKTQWLNLNTSWAVFFSVLGFINIYVAYHFSTDTWVNFKLFGLLSLTLLFIIGQAVYLGSQLKKIKEEAMTLVQSLHVFIQETLTTAFSPTLLEVTDESAQHQDHGGYNSRGSHFSVTIAGDAFKDKELLECHRMIYAALGTAVGQEIHALRITIQR